MRMAYKNLGGGVVKLWGLINKREKKSDPRLACIVFYKIAVIYRNMK